ncbi:hypothetical protein DPMN_023278 [Dreissena polymorpha]|uniref:B box-type domain-containing protein n=1 Tax=Dreissena polymorpha TaxID=45954 RepID=A0A9D4LLT9_DREPO|nr:hypothetical protein DPMN_023278 [Dreissena polymorpha]
MCLINYLKTFTDKSQFPCPVCKGLTLTTSPISKETSEMVEKFPVDFDLANIVDSVRESKHLAEVEETELFRQVSACPPPCSKRVTRVCKQHDIFCCDACAVKHHKTCELSLIENAFQENDNTVSNDLDRMIGQLTHLIAKEKSLEQKAIKDEKDINHEVDEEAKSVEKALEDTEHMLLEQLKSRIDKLNVSSAENLAVVKNLKRKLNDVKTQLEVVFSMGTQIQKFIMIRDAGERITAISCELDATVSKFDCAHLELETPCIDHITAMIDETETVEIVGKTIKDSDEVRT